MFELGIPGLRGELALDADSIGAAARDAGGLVSLVPQAVLRPASVEDVLLAVRFCRRHNIKLVARGAGHTTFAQAQVQGGLVVDMSSLVQLHALEPDHAVVSAGTSWRMLLEHATKEGHTPPVLTGFQGLSIGGTLSVGGISGVSYRRGAQVDHVLEVDVVTGDAQHVTCSMAQNRDLFEAVLGGGGRFGIIVRATLSLIPAPTQARITVLSYEAFAPFIRDMRTLIGRAALEGVSGTIWLEPRSHTRYELNAVSFYSPPRTPETARLLQGIGDEAERSTSDVSYVDYTLVVNRLLDKMGDTGTWSERTHPWFDAFLPDANLERWMSAVLPTLNPKRDVGPPELGSLGQIHLFPLLKRHLTRPSLRVPDGDLSFLFDILTSSRELGSDPAYAAEMLARNRRLFLEARTLGGIPYPISAIPLSSPERRAQLGERLHDLERLKSKYDPGRILREL